MTIYVQDDELLIIILSDCKFLSCTLFAFLISSTFLGAVKMLCNIDFESLGSLWESVIKCLNPLPQDLQLRF